MSAGPSGYTQARLREGAGLRFHWLEKLERAYFHFSMFQVMVDEVELFAGPSLNVDRLMRIDGGP